MNTQLYIPKRIKVGYVKRDGTYSGKLAYIIYYDDKGKLRKETSWESWRDKTIEAEEYDNKPQPGFVLNKDIKRYNWGHFSSNRTLIRVYDPRGIEFEITTENLIGCLMNSDCSKRGLSGEFVYAWCGPELVLLPTSCEEYEKAVSYTGLQSGKVGAKDLVAGCSYKTKKEEDLIYVGRYNWYSVSWYTSKKKEKFRTPIRYHIFAKKAKDGDYYAQNGYVWSQKSNLDFLASKTSDEPVSDFASMIEAFQKLRQSADIVKFETVPAQVSFQTNDSQYSGPTLAKTDYFKIVGDLVQQYDLTAVYHSGYNREANKTIYTFLGYHLNQSYTFNQKTKEAVSRGDRYDSYSYRGYGRDIHTIYMTADQVCQQGLCDLYVTLDNGQRNQINSLSQL